jgi:hypothetical protein
MPKKRVVMYVEDQERTRERVVPLLRELGVEVVEYDVLENAKAAFVTNKPYAVILGGELQVEDDGWIWGEDLYVKGVLVLMYSLSRPRDAPDGLPYLNKWERVSTVKETFRSFLNDI